MRILIIDDEPHLATYAAKTLDNHTVRTAYTCSDGYLSVRRFAPDVILLDSHIIGNTKPLLTLAKKLEIPILLLEPTEQVESPTQQHVLEDNAIDYVAKSRLETLPRYLAAI